MPPICSISAIRPAIPREAPPVPGNAKLLAFAQLPMISREVL